MDIGPGPPSHKAQPPSLPSPQLKKSRSKTAEVLWEVLGPPQSCRTLSENNLFCNPSFSLEQSTCHPLHWQSLWQSWSTSKTSGISVSLTSRMSTLGSWLGNYSEKVSFFSTLWGQPPEATQSSFPILNRITPPGQPAPNIFVLTKSFLCVASFILCQMSQPVVIVDLNVK